MPAIELHRFFPASPTETYDALLEAVQVLARYQTGDDFARAVTFSTRTSLFASGANVSAHVRAMRGGAEVWMEGQAKMRSQANANNAAHKQLSRILDAVSEFIQDNRGDS